MFKGWRTAPIIALILAISLTACSGQSTDQTATPGGSAGQSGVVVDKPDCKDTTRAQTTVQTFFTNYNAGNLNATLATLDPKIRSYFDGTQDFRADSGNLPAIQSHLSAMFSVHDHFTYGAIKITTDPATALDDYYVIVDNVTRTDDSLLTRRVPSNTGQVIMGVHCLTPQISILLIETLGS
jgi:hypothetical protein